MGLTPAEIDALEIPTASQMVKLIKWAMTELASSPEVNVQGPNGRGYTFRSMDEAQRALQFWLDQEAREAADAAGAGCFEYADLSRGV